MLALAAGAGPAWGEAAAGKPAGDQQYVLLHNGNVLRGSVVVAGPQVLLRTGKSSEIKLDAQQVAFTAPTLGGLYTFRAAQRDSNDLAGHLEDARWCLRGGLHDEMGQSLQAARRLDDSHPELLRLQRQLQVALQPPPAAPVALVPQPAAPAEAEAAAKAEAETAAAARTPPPWTADAELEDLQVSSDLLAHFTSRVQPILLNRCGNAGCHRSPTEAAWQLTHMGVQVRPPARMTRLNLVATLQWIDRAAPEQSELLRYAVEPHAGRREPPLRPSDDVAIHALQLWAHLVAQSSLGERAVPLTPLADPAQTTAAVPAAVPLPRLPQQTAAGSSDVQQAGYLWEQDFATEPVPAATTPPRSRSGSPAASRPTRLPPVDDPFDPGIFNRLYRTGAALEQSR